MRYTVRKMFENLKIRERLRKAFTIIVIVSSIAGVVGAIAMMEAMTRISDTSATAEESSATSQELSAQAISLDELISKFILPQE